MNGVGGDAGEPTAGGSARELAAVPEPERWQRLADLAAAHGGDDDLAGDDPADS